MSTETMAQVGDVLQWLQKTATGAHLCADTRALQTGDVFFAYPGEASDGRNFISQALAAGAGAVVYEAENYTWPANANVPHLAVDKLKSKVGKIANGFYDYPDKDMFVAAVTGTNGKTSCTQWLGSALSGLEVPTAVIGTLGSGLYREGLAEEFVSTGNTTPDAILLQRRLSELRRAGARGLAIEASSIGLAQQRLSGLHIDVAIFTNLTRDHLDYHGDMAAYEAAKTMLFEVADLKHAVLNLDDPMGLRLARHVQAISPSTSIIGFTLEGKNVEGVSVVHADAIVPTQTGTSFHVQSPFGVGTVKSQVVGQFNVSNLLAILGVLLAKGTNFENALHALEQLTPVNGRMQQAGGEDAPLVVIDYAHTPDALEKVLTALRPIAMARHGELWCVFGCGGDRDPGKRPQMGQTALTADHVIVTSDNPRSEEPAVIIEQIMQGMSQAKAGTVQAIEDRAAAILWAIKHASKNDVVLLAGKGHESTQEIKGKKLPFLDADHAALALAARVTMKGAH